MTQLKSLTFAALPKLTAADPVIWRRNKLIARLQQQIALVQDPNFTLTRQKWIADEAGVKQLRSLPKKVRPCWRTDATGAVVLTVRYGAKPIEFAPGKAAIGDGSAHPRKPKRRDGGELSGETINYFPPTGNTKKMRHTIIAIIALLCLAAPATAQRAASDNDIAEAIIRECLAIYHAGRPCACPEDATRNGSRCGRRSAYYRRGGAVPRCYVKDMTPEEIAHYRNGKKDFFADCEPTR